MLTIRFRYTFQYFLGESFHRMIMLAWNFEIFRNNICVTNGMRWNIGYLHEIMKNVIVLLSEEASRVFYFFVFVTSFCLRVSWINHRYRHNVSLYIFHLSLSSRGQPELRIRLISASSCVRWVPWVCVVLLVLEVLSEFCGIVISFDSPSTNDVEFWLTDDAFSLDFLTFKSFF